MTITPEDLDQIARLAYLETTPESAPDLAKEISSIMDFVEQLRTIDTTGIEPLYHACENQQSTREDIVTEGSCVQQLGAIAPQFADDFYLVPKVLDAGK